jgi:hypothetical protein
MNAGNKDLREMSSEQIKNLCDWMKECVHEDEMASLWKKINDDERYAQIDEANSNFDDPDGINFTFHDKYVEFFRHFKETHMKQMMYILDRSSAEEKEDEEENKTDDSDKLKKKGKKSK